MKLLTSTICILMWNISHGAYEEVKSVIYTQPSKDEKTVKRWKKSGLFHTGNLLNKRIKNLKAYIDRKTGSVKVSFDYPTSEWSIGAYAFPMDILCADVNGKILNTNSTPELVPKGVFNRTKPGTFARAYLDKRPNFNQEKASFLYLKNNELEFKVPMRDAPYIKIVQAGFVTTRKTRTHDPVREFMPEKIFIKDWAKEKVYEK